ncbi:hypothetical protein C3L33_11323, partial [Rhododendron williamsianum]
MAKTTTTHRRPTKKTHQNKNPNPPKQEKPQQSWAVFRSLLTCKHIQQQLESQKHQQNQKLQEPPLEESSKKTKKMKCSGSLCNNTKVMHRAEPLSSSSPEESKKNVLSSLGSGNGSSRSMRVPLIGEQSNGAIVSSSSNPAPAAAAAAGSFRSGMPFRRFSGCYECSMVVDPVLGITRDPSLRSSICSCPHCGEIFTKSENLELHQAVRHAVSELGAEDTSKNIVEIIFQSSWLKKQSPVCKIDRILKVQNTPKTIAKFEEYRDSIKSKSTKKQPRCVADGNELLRFHSTTLLCSLGLNGSSNLCNSIPSCNICSIIKNGFRVGGKGILTTATSGKADDSAAGVADEDGEKRAMLVCRVIAGRVRKNNVTVVEGGSVEEEYDSVAGATTGVYSSLEELYVFNPRAILPCFVVIYQGY